jgi:hypothetical protein
MAGWWERPPPTSSISLTPPPPFPGCTRPPSGSPQRSASGFAQGREPVASLARGGNKSGLGPLVLGLRFSARGLAREPKSPPSGNKTGGELRSIVGPPRSPKGDLGGKVPQRRSRWGRGALATLAGTAPSDVKHQLDATSPMSGLHPAPLRLPPTLSLRLRSGERTSRFA